MCFYQTVRCHQGQSLILRWGYCVEDRVVQKPIYYDGLGTSLDLLCAGRCSIYRRRASTGLGGSILPPTRRFARGATGTLGNTSFVSPFPTRLDTGMLCMVRALANGTYGLCRSASFHSAKGGPEKLQFLLLFEEAQYGNG
jgi:hypothetical protein